MILGSKRQTQRKRPLSTTPVRNALVADSFLQEEIRNGLGAVERTHRAYIDMSLRREFGDSLNLDEALRAGHEQENRWDYLLGHTRSATVIGLEPHSAKSDEISTVIAKRKVAMEQLRSHLKPGARVGSWLWVASGRVHFADTENARLRLDQHGIQFVGPRVVRKHLPTVQCKANER